MLTLKLPTTIPCLYGRAFQETIDTSCMKKENFTQFYKNLT